MQDLKLKIDKLISLHSRTLPLKSTLDGLIENLGKKEQLLPLIENEINRIIREYHNGKGLTELEAREIKGIVASAINNFMKS